MKLVKLLAAAALAVVVALGLTAVATAQSDDDEKVVLTVGRHLELVRHAESARRRTRVLDYDVWILQYDTAHSKSAAATSRRSPASPSRGKHRTTARRSRTRCATASKWSDGEPLTAKDVAFTINRSRDEELAELQSRIRRTSRPKVLDDRTVEVTSSVPDPKLPGLGDIYILPEHVWGKFSAEEIAKYPGEDGVGSGPFTLDGVQERAST